MRKWYIILSLVAIVLSGCKSIAPYGTINIETRTYTGDIGGLEYTGWQKNVPMAVEKGATLYHNEAYHISVVADHIYADGIRLKFSGPVTLANESKNADNFYVKKNQTATFVAGGGVDGLEIKVKYN